MIAIKKRGVCRFPLFQSELPLRQKPCRFPLSCRHSGSGKGALTAARLAKQCSAELAIWRGASHAENGGCLETK
jgi:hypothetical protein